MQIHLYFFITVLLCLSNRYSFLEIKPELRRNILKFGYSINYKYEGMLAHSFDRFYVITKFVLPTLDDLKLSPIRCDKECNYLRNLDDQDDGQIKENIRDLILYCSKVRQFVALYKMKSTVHNVTAHKIFKNKVNLILPKFHKEHRSKRGIFGAISSGFLGLAFKGISSFLHHKRHKALQKAAKAMSISTEAQRNKLMHLENFLIMYGVYNAKTLEKLVKSAHVLHSQQSVVEDLFAGQKLAAYEIYSKMKNACGVQHYMMNALLYLHAIKEKYIVVCNEFITQLHIYTKAVRILAKGHLPISLMTPYKLQEIINSVKETLIKSNPDYDIVIKGLHFYYNMKLVTFGIDQDRNLIIQFPIFVQPYTQQPLILYQLETVPVPTIDQNPNAQSYIELRIKKPLFRLNSETYINI